MSDDCWCKIEVPIVKLPHANGLKLPEYATVGSSGLDLLAAIEEELVILPGHIELIPTGIKIAIPPPFELQIRPRSGLAIKHGVTVVNAPGTIDSDYRGEIKVGLINLSKDEFIIKRGMRIAQAVLSKVYKIRWKEVKELSETKRGSGGFGHTGMS